MRSFHGYLPFARTYVADFTRYVYVCRFCICVYGITYVGLRCWLLSRRLVALILPRVSTHHGCYTLPLRFYRSHFAFAYTHVPTTFDCRTFFVACVRCPFALRYRSRLRYRHLPRFYRLHHAATLRSLVPSPRTPRSGWFP